MRIYYASQSFYPFIGGVSTYLLNLAKEMAKKGNEVVEVHLRSSHAESEEEVKGIAVHRVPKEPIDKEVMLGYSQFKEAVYKECHENKNLFTRPADQIAGFHEFNIVNQYFGEQIKKLLEEGEADVVHIHDFQLLFAYKYVPRGTPLILTWHIPFIENISPHLAEFLVKHLNEYDKIVFSSQDYIEAAVKAGLPPEKTALISPLANTNLFHPLEINRNEVRARYQIPLEAKTILCVQRIDPKSGHEQLIRALPLILKKVPTAKIVFVGSESLSNKLSQDREALIQQTKQLVKDLNLSDSVIWTGNIDYPLLPELYSSVDLVALCSKNEGFGLSVTEGMSCGNPIIGTRVGGIPLQVEDGINGFLVDVGDIEATAEKICQILEDNQLREQMSLKSKEIVENNFRMELGIQKHLVLYNKVINEKDELHKIEYLDSAGIKGIITDLDRTITDQPAKTEFDPDDFDSSLFKEMKTLNIDLFLASGRSIHYIKKLCSKFNAWRAAIAENGAVIYFPSTLKTITLNTAHMAKAKKIIRGLNLPGSIIGKVIASIRAEDEILVREKLGDLVNKVGFFRNVDEVMILPQGVDKGLGVRLAMQYLNLNLEKTIVIGDGENDVDMFLNPGFKVALANAHPKLKELANQVTTESCTKGVREVVKKLKG